MIDGVQVIDFHAHSCRGDAYGMINDPALMLHAMDRAGIDKACLNHVWYPGGTRGNDLTARLVAQHPDRFLGVAYVSPLMPARMISELTRAVDELGFVAIKLYPPYIADGDFSRPEWDPIYQFADERGLAVLFHTGQDAPPQALLKIAPRFPKAHFVAGHSGNTPQERAQAIAAAQAYPNVYLETCSTFRTPGVIEQLVEEAGADRVLFGTDMPLMDPRAQLGKIITACIPDEAKRQVLGENVRRLLGI
jgi:uncharacterized protein